MNPEHELSQNQCGQLAWDGKQRPGCSLSTYSPHSLQNCCCFDAKHTMAKNSAASIFQTTLSTFFGPLMCAPRGAFPWFLNPPWTPEGCRSTKQCLLHCTGTVLARMAACPCVPCPWAAAGTLFIVCTTRLPGLHLFAGAKCLHLPHMLSAGQKH